MKVGIAQAMLLAAGRGERMRPLSDHTPKPLLSVRGKALLQWQLEALARADVAEVLVNTAWLGEQISNHFGSLFGLQRPSDGRGQLLNSEHLRIRYSPEGRDFGAALETAGGIVRALPHLADPFWLSAGDVFAPDFAFSPDAVHRFGSSGLLAHLWLVPNPAHNPRGDFGLGTDGLALNLGPEDAGPRYTYSTIGLYRHALFAPPWCDIPAGNPRGVKAALAPLLRKAMDNRLVSAERYAGTWVDVGTPQRLTLLNTGATP